MTLRVRFAPSPTGKLHIGNVRAALLNWLCARHGKGEFILRYDDTDKARSKQEYITAIAQDLKWLGLNWEHTFYQSQRMALYAQAIAKLKAAGRLYPCYETPEELEFKRRRQRAQGQPPIYDRAALQLTEQEGQKLEAAGRRPHWRFKLLPQTISWDDQIHGSLVFQGENLSDPVLIREDGCPLYMLPSVVDDIDMGITHILRGEDHITNTAIQMQLMEALGGTPSNITFAHFSWLVSQDGTGLSKRAGSLSIESLRQQGYEPQAIHSLLARLGTSLPVEPVTSMQPLIDQFRMDIFARNAVKFNPEDLTHLNAKCLHMLPFDHVAERLQDMVEAEVEENFWRLCRENITFLKDFKLWWQVAYGTITPVIEEAAYTAQALEMMPEGPFTEETWQAWTHNLKEATGRKGKALFMPLRQALTGQEHGPEMRLLLPYIGAEKTQRRLQGEVA